MIDKVDYSFAEEATMTAEEKAEVERERTGWLTSPKRRI